MHEEVSRRASAALGVSRTAEWRDALLLGLMTRAAARAGIAPLSVRLPSGLSGHVGRPGAPEAGLEVRSFRLLWDAMMRGNIGFAEAYLRGDVTTPDLGRLFRYFLSNYGALTAAGRGVFKTRLPDRLAHRARRNTRRGSRRNIAAHYDLGNAFYRSWLDPSMTYSSALYENAAMPLEEAQAAKYARIIEALEVAAGDRVLEIGCGWGGMAEALAARGANVTGITVSAEQLAFARARLAPRSGPDRARGSADIRFEDYRDTSGTFDRLVSVEMIEAVGEENWPLYFETLQRRLRPGGIGVIQAITMREEDFDIYRSRPDFIQRFIFPGGVLPTPQRIHAHAAAAGLSCETVLRFGKSYALTLAEWRRRFLFAWPQIAALGFDERFRRMWDYYLTYCEVGFGEGVTDVALYRVVKPAA